MTRAMEKYLRRGLAGTNFCPGCGHGILLGAVLRAVDRLGLEPEDLLFVSGIGCAAWIPSPNIGTDTLHTLHGRALAFATGAKLANPALETIVVSGDGDLTSIGGNHLIHSARRDLDVTVICANNQIYGMTGGQTASTTPIGARTSTDPDGSEYRPFDIVELVLAAGARYAARFPVTRPRPLIDAIEKALRIEGFTFVEAISPCPTQFGRRNRLADLPQLYEQLESICISPAEAEQMEERERLRHFVIGEFER
ncbi:MAG: thiamine pyrophosphate-dependent enzyme [Polyangia bacterium]